MAGYYPKLKTDGISEKLLPELLLVHKVEARPWLGQSTTSDAKFLPEYAKVFCQNFTGIYPN